MYQLTSAYNYGMFTRMRNNDNNITLEDFYIIQAIDVFILKTISNSQKEKRVIHIFFSINSTNDVY